MLLRVLRILCSVLLRVQHHPSHSCWTSVALQKHMTQRTAALSWLPMVHLKCCNVSDMQDDDLLMTLTNDPLHMQDDDLLLTPTHDPSYIQDDALLKILTRDPLQVARAAELAHWLVRGSTLHPAFKRSPMAFSMRMGGWADPTTKVRNRHNQ